MKKTTDIERAIEFNIKSTAHYFWIKPFVYSELLGCEVAIAKTNCHIVLIDKEEKVILIFEDTETN